MGNLMTGNTREFRPKTFGWRGEFADFCDRLMTNPDCVPYVFIRCDCGRPLSVCECENSMVTPVFNGTGEWLAQWLQSH